MFAWLVVGGAEPRQNVAEEQGRLMATDDFGNKVSSLFDRSSSVVLDPSLIINYA